VSGSLPTPLADLLGYLRDLGYGDLYLGPAGPAPAPTAPATAVQAPAASPPIALPAVESRVRLPPKTEPGERAQRLAVVAEEAAGCTACRLAQGRNRVVFGSGDPDAELMFIGEGPGAEEDRQGLPFVGRAGELLTKIIQAIDLGREQVYIANIVKCRPPGNRDPEADEAAACRGFLDRQIELVQPRVIVALGRIAAQSLLGTDTPISKLRGQWYTVQGIPTMVTFHPAALLRNPALKRPTWDDMQKVRDRLRASGAATP